MKSENETAPTGIGAKVKHLLKAIFGSRRHAVKSEAWRKAPTVHLTPIKPRQWEQSDAN